MYIHFRNLPIDKQSVDRTAQEMGEALREAVPQQGKEALSEEAKARRIRILEQIACEILPNVKLSMAEKTAVTENRKASEITTPKGQECLYNFTSAEPKLMAKIYSELAPTEQKALRDAINDRFGPLLHVNDEDGKLIIHRTLTAHDDLSVGEERITIDYGNPGSDGLPSTTYERQIGTEKFVPCDEKEALHGLRARVDEIVRQRFLDALRTRNEAQIQNALKDLANSAYQRAWNLTSAWQSVEESVKRALQGTEFSLKEFTPSSDKRSVRFKVAVGDSQLELNFEPSVPAKPVEAPPPLPVPTVNWKT